MSLCGQLDFPTSLILCSVHIDHVNFCRFAQFIKNRGFPTRVVHLHYISCLRYTIVVGNPQNASRNSPGDDSVTIVFSHSSSRRGNTRSATQL